MCAADEVSRAATARVPGQRTAKEQSSGLRVGGDALEECERVADAVRGVCLELGRRKKRIDLQPVRGRRAARSERCTATISCSKMLMVPNECHKMGARSKASARLASVAAGVRTWYRLALLAELQESGLALVGVRELKHERVDLIRPSERCRIGARRLHLLLLGLGDVAARRLRRVERPGHERHGAARKIAGTQRLVGSRLGLGRRSRFRVWHSCVAPPPGRHAAHLHAHRARYARLAA